jgi:hypothetical protein
MRPRWLAWAAFILSFFAPTPGINPDQEQIHHNTGVDPCRRGIELLDYSLFIPHTGGVEDGG